MFGPLRRWWQEKTGEEETPFDGDTPAWVISIAFHLVVLVILALVWIYRPDTRMVMTMPLADEEPEQLIEEAYFSPDPQPTLGANSVNGDAAALASADLVADVSVVPVKVDTFSNPTVDVEFNLDRATAATFDQNITVKGAAGVGATGAVGAVDRITFEILRSLEERSTLVVWLFDQSGSLDRTRAAIYDRFDKIYQELGVLEKSGHDAFAQSREQDKPLLTAVMAFGKEVSFRMENPTSDLTEIKAALKGIENDASGIENVFTAVGKGVRKYSKYRNSPRRNILMIVVSDEVGDDENLLDPCVGLCQRFQIPVYVVGVPAPFGRKQAMIKYVDPDPKYDQSVQWIPVRQGPESVMSERIRLNFSSGRNRELDELDSGFGPFALTRLCVETGGIYFTVHPNKTAGARAMGRNKTEVMTSRLRYFFDPAIMRQYRPEYVSIMEYERRRDANQARVALVAAAQRSRVDSMSSPQTRFAVVSEAALKRQLDEAQKSSAKLEPKINQIYSILARGEKDRPNERVLRWQAGYDLAMGRILAMKVRTETYNSMLAQLKGGRRFKTKGSDTWILEPADNTVGSKLEKLKKQADMYLQRVVQEHADTPWALLAERELKEPLGWKWTEAHTGVNDPPRNAGGNGNNNPAADKLNKLKKPRRKRSSIKL